MQVNLLTYNERTDRFHVDSFDLYHLRSRRTFTLEATDEIGASESQLRSDLGRVLLKLEQLQADQKRLSKANAPEKQITATERREAMVFMHIFKQVSRPRTMSNQFYAFRCFCCRSLTELRRIVGVLQAV